MFNVEIQATNKTWFIAEEGEGLDPVAAGLLVDKLRAQGFYARARFADENNGDDA